MAEAVGSGYILRVNPEVFASGGDVGCDQDWPEEGSVSYHETIIGGLLGVKVGGRVVHVKSEMPNEQLALSV